MPPYEVTNTTTFITTYYFHHNARIINKEKNRQSYRDDFNCSKIVTKNNGEQPGAIPRRPPNRIVRLLPHTNVKEFVRSPRDPLIDKIILTFPWSQYRERVRRIIATINLKEPSNNLYGICAGCHPLMLSRRFGVPGDWQWELFSRCARVGCATDDEIILFASSLDFAVKTLEDPTYCLVALYELCFVTVLLFAVDKHLATRMDLMNKDLLTLRIDEEVNPVSFYKQDPKLVAAIDSLFSSRREGNSGNLLLSGRKLDFCKVQQLLMGKANENDFVNVSSNTPSHVTNDEKKIVLQKIENILEQINESAGTSQPPKLLLRNQRLWSNCIYDLDRVTLKTFNDAKKTTVIYSNTQDRTRFNAIVFVLCKVHELLTKDLTVTRRELFYQNVARFRNQANLDVGVRDVCCLLETPPWNLGIVATAKGLVAGPLVMKNRDGSTIDCCTTGGTLLPQDINGIKAFKSSAKYILVVEKDAIFQKLLDEGALIRLGPMIILTGKGYPDVCTRQLLCRLVKELRLTALALVDHDPHGYEIFLTYKYGSLAQSHLSSSLACASLLLLGIRFNDVMTLVPHEARLSLTNLDKRKLGSLIKRPYLDTPAGVRIREELQSMLDSGIKAEIEAVAPTAAALCDSYIPSKIIQAEFLG